MMKEIVLYSKDNCQACRLMKSQLDKMNVNYKVENILENTEQLEYFRSIGILQLPILTIDKTVEAYGMRVDKAKQALKNHGIIE